MVAGVEECRGVAVSFDGKLQSRVLVGRSEAGATWLNATHPAWLRRHVSFVAGSSSHQLQLADQCDAYANSTPAYAQCYSLLDAVSLQRLQSAGSALPWNSSAYRCPALSGSSGPSGTPTPRALLSVSSVSPNATTDGWLRVWEGPAWLHHWTVRYVRVRANPDGLPSDSVQLGRSRSSARAGQSSAQACPSLSQATPSLTGATLARCVATFCLIAPLGCPSRLPDPSEPARFPSGFVVLARSS